MNDNSPHPPSNAVTENDPDRPPQLNEDYINKIYTGDPSYGSAEGDRVPPDIPPVESEDDDSTSIASSDDGEQPVSSDEGVEDHHIDADMTENHLIEVGNMGYIPFRTIFEALARHVRCTCHHGFGIVPSTDDYSFTTRSSRHASRVPTRQGSMVVELGSEEQSLASSLLSLQSRNSSTFAFTGAWVTHDALVPDVGRYIFNPLRLTPDLAAYPMALSISDDELSQHEGWRGD